MGTKIYKCPIHGEFEHECNISDGELKMCPKTLGIFDIPITTEIIERYKNLTRCNQPVTRVYKSMAYLDSEGFVGKIYGTP